MSFIEWKPNFSVELEAIDKQHQILIKWMNAFYNANAMNHKDNAKESLEQLIKYTKLHFEDEERMMLSVDYSDFANHKKSHEQLLSLVEKLAGSYLKNPTESNAQELSNFLKKWLTNHILGIDKRYVDSAKQKGLN